MTQADERSPLSSQHAVNRSLLGFFFFSSRRRHTRYWRDWSSDVCSSDLVQVLISKRDPEYPLPDQGRDLVLDQFPTSHIVKARCKPLHHLDGAVRRAKQQCSGIRRDHTGVERRHHLASFNRFKSKQIRDTFRGHPGAPRFGEKWLWHNGFR